MNKGIIRSMPEGKAFGFIQMGVKDFFFHRENFNGDWKDLTRKFNGGHSVNVEFDIVESPKGPRAENVSVI